MGVPSKFDNEMLPLTRVHINDFVKKVADTIPTKTGLLLEIGPQDRKTIKELFKGFQVETLDIVDTYSPTYVGDITKRNSVLKSSSYDLVVCMEVLEHTLNPFSAIKELRRILKHGGYLMVSAPLNFRIHGPSPDCWRFTEHGWRVLLKDFDILDIDILETPDRELFPVKYNVLARCDKKKKTRPDKINFRFI